MKVRKVPGILHISLAPGEFPPPDLVEEFAKKVAELVLEATNGEETQVQVIPKGAIMHVTVGVPGEWTADQEEINQVAEMFTQASEDEDGAVVVTRDGVHIDVICLPEDRARSGFVKMLRATDEEKYEGILKNLEDKGVPLTPAMWMTAASKPEKQ